MAKSQNPFTDSFKDMDFTKAMDFNKLMEQWPIPGVDTNAILEAQRKNIEAITNANRVAMEGAQAVSRRQMELLRSTMEETSKVMQDMAASGAPEEKMARQAEVAKQSFEKAIANMRELAEMSAKSNTEAMETINKRVSESLDEIKQMLEGMREQAKEAKSGQ